MSTVLGIDLGTTNTVVAVVKDGQAAALADQHGERLLPSVVSFHPSGNVLVGRAAKERRLVDASNTVYSVKRLIGRSWDSEEVRRARERFPFEMREGPGQATLVAARGETYTLPEISAFVLRRAKAIAEAALGESVERAVITVPANFNDLQRAATKVAGRVAGLEVLRILNEPTAAALAYGYGKGTSERIAVYDFGGGTFDVTLLDLAENVFEVLATAGNTFLGGDDIDLALAERLADAFLLQHRYDVREDPQAFERIRAAAEVLKIRLSSETEVSMTVPEVAHGAKGQALDLQFKMARGEFEALCSEIVDHTFDVCREALGVARLKPDDFDQILLVGGSTRIPMVRTRVEEFFKRPVLGHISPDEVVAIGAAIQASALTGAERRRGDIPAPPQPARSRRQGTLPPGQRASQPLMPPSFDPHTEPYGGRKKMPTSPGLHPEGGASPAGTPRPLVVAPPGSVPAEPSPHTQDRGHRPRRDTGAGLGPPPATIAGLGARARIPTGPGLGPAAIEARRRLGSQPDDTLTSPAREARATLDRSRTTGSSAGADIPLPLVGVPDAQLDDYTKPTTDAARAMASAEDATSENADVARSLAAYSRSPASTLSSADREARQALETTDESVPVFQLDESDMVDESSNMFALGPSTEQLRKMAAPASTDEVTQVGKRRTGSVVNEHTLPIPEEPAEEVTTTAGVALGASPTLGSAGPFGGAAFGPGGTTAMPARPAQPAAGFGGAIAPPAAPPAAAVPFQPAAVATMPLAAAADFMPQAAAPPAPPLLVDVTPLSLTVETVGGFCDPIIQRNTPVPCEETRSFATASDGQTAVRVRVSQGESPIFGQNTLLGEVELSGLTPGPRGQVSIAVTFALDTDGILNVRAREVATGREATTRVRLVAVPDASQLASMAARHATHNVVG